MKKFLIGIFACLILFSCNNNLEPTISPNEILVKEFSLSIGTKTAQPLTNTIWECDIEGKYNLYMWFWNSTYVNVFYGMIEDNTLERWSPFYGNNEELYSPDKTIYGDFYGGCKYTLNEKYELNTNLVFPLYQNNEVLNEIKFGKINNNFTLAAGNKLFKYYGLYNNEDLDSMWMCINVGISPWQ